MKLDIKDIERIVLLGSGKLIVALVRWCRSDGVPVFVVTSPRHSEELVEHNTSLKGFLINEKIPFLVTEDIVSSEVEDFLGDLSDAFCLSLGAAWIFKEKVHRFLKIGFLILTPLACLRTVEVEASVGKYLWAIDWRFVRFI